VKIETEESREQSEVKLRKIDRVEIHFKKENGEEKQLEKLKMTDERQKDELSAKITQLEQTIRAQSN